MCRGAEACSISELWVDGFLTLAGRQCFPRGSSCGTASDLSVLESASGCRLKKFRHKVVLKSGGKYTSTANSEVDSKLSHWSAYPYQLVKKLLTSPIRIRPRYHTHVHNNYNSYMPRPNTSVYHIKAVSIGTINRYTQDWMGVGKESLRFLVLFVQPIIWNERC